MQAIMIRCTALFFFLFFLVPCTSHAKDKLSFAQQKVLYEAQQAIEKKDYAQARKMLSSYLAEHPDTQPALFFLFLGNACYEQEDVKAAAKWYRLGLDKNPENLFLCRNLAAIQYDLEKFSEAGRLFEKAYGLSDPRQHPLLYQSAAAFYQAQQLDQAQRILTRLLAEKTPPRREWLVLMIQVCYERHDTKRSLQYLESFLESYPWERTYWKILAGIRMEKEQYSQAASALRTALALGKTTSQEWRELSSLYFYMNAPLQGAKCLEKALSPSASPKDYDAVARGYLLAHRTDKGLHYLDAAIAAEPTYTRLMLKAKTLMGARRFSDAILVLEKTLTLKPKSQDESYLLMAYCAVEQQEWKQAATWLYNVKSDKFRPYAKSIKQAIAPILDAISSSE